MDLSNPYRRKLQTKRLDLILFDHSNQQHYEATLAVINNPVAYAQMGDYGIHTNADLDNLFDRTRLRKSLFAKPSTKFPPDEMVGHVCHYVVQLKTGEMIGGASLAQRGPHLAPDIGWAITPDHHSKGYASEAATELLRYVREDLHLKEIIAWPNPENVPSARVATKIGLVEAGKMKDRDSGELVTVYALPGMKFEGIPEIGF